MNRYLQRNPSLSWQVEQAKWVFGKKNLKELLIYLRKFSEILPNSDNPTEYLIFLGNQEHFYPIELGERFVERLNIPSKKIVRFGANDPSCLHCQNGAGYLSQEEIFTWLEV